jgi:hypothetical protein
MAGRIANLESGISLFRFRESGGFRMQREVAPAL